MITNKEEIKFKQTIILDLSFFSIKIKNKKIKGDRK